MMLAMHLVIFIAIIALRNRPNPLAAMLFCTSTASDQFISRNKYDRLANTISGC
jgi:hypothetical protein